MSVDSFKACIMNCVYRHMSLNHGIALFFLFFYLAVVHCMFLCVERENCSCIFFHVIAGCLKFCILSYCVCVFMRSCLINVLLSLTHFSLAWCFVSHFLNNESYKYSLFSDMLLCLLMSCFPLHIYSLNLPYNMFGYSHEKSTVWMC